MTGSKALAMLLAAVISMAPLTCYAGGFGIPRLRILEAPPDLAPATVLADGSWLLSPETAAFVRDVIIDYHAMPGAVERREELLEARCNDEIRLVSDAVAHAERVRAEEEQLLPTWSWVAIVGGAFVLGGALGFLGANMAGR